MRVRVRVARVQLHAEVAYFDLRNAYTDLGASFEPTRSPRRWQLPRGSVLYNVSVSISPRRPAVR